MESCTVELVSNASAQLIPDNTLGAYINFLPEQLNLEEQSEVTILERSHPSRYQNVAVGKIMFLIKKISKFSEFF